MFQRKLRLINLLAVFTLLLHANAQIDRYSRVSAAGEISPTQDATASNASTTGNDVAPAGQVSESVPSGSRPESYDATAFASGQSGLYQPIGEVVVPSGDQLITRGVEEKDGYVYLLTRTEYSTLAGYLYTYDVSDLPTRTSFVRYNSPISSRQLSNGNGLLRNGNYMYAFGSGGLAVLSVQNPASPTLIGSRYDLVIYNLIQYSTYLIAPGYGGVAVYSISNPANPVLLSIYRVSNKYFYSAAVYGNTLYTYEFEVLSFNPATYNTGFRVLDFSNPSSPSLIRLMNPNKAANHLRIIGNKLIECTDITWGGFVGLWSLDTPTNPVFQTSQPASTRVCALDGNKIVVNGKAFRPNGNALELIDTFTAGYVQADGFPYGSAVTSGFVFIAQSPRILILKKGNPIVGDARLDIGMPYNAYRGCPSPYVGCGGPFHGFYNGVCTDLVLDAYSAGIGFNIQSALEQDHRANLGRYRYGSARNAEDMRRYFSRNQLFLSHSQPYQLGDIAFFDWDGDGLTNHVLVISEVDASSRPLKMVDASGVIPSINPSGWAFEHSWSNYYEQHVQGHARLGSTSLVATSAITETLQILRVTVSSASVGLSLFDSNGKSVSEVYDENLVANNIETSIPYIPGGSYENLGVQKVITVTQPLSNTNQYFVRIEGQANTTYTLLIETLQDASVTASHTFTQAIGAGETQNAGIIVSAPSGVISFTTQSPTSSPVVNLPSSLSLSGLVGTSAQLTFTVSETGGQQAISNTLITATDLSTQYGIKILSNQLTITPANFSVVAGGNQQVGVQISLVDLNPGEYLGSLILTSQNGNPVMIPFTLQVQYHTLYLPYIARN